MAVELRPAGRTDIDAIWRMLQDAIAQRKADGSEQWQNGYPNERTVLDDVASGAGYLLTVDGSPALYAAIILGDEPAYDQIDGAWLSQGRYAVIHRIARSAKDAGRGLSSTFFDLAEALCRAQGMTSIRLDTNFDNLAMQRVLQQRHYQYCGEIVFQGASRMAYEKLL